MLDLPLLMHGKDVNKSHLHKKEKVWRFMISFGGFPYEQAPIGVNSISEHYNRRISEGLPNITKVVDNIVYSPNDLAIHATCVRNF